MENFDQDDAERIIAGPARAKLLAQHGAELSRYGAKIIIPCTSPLFDKVLEMVAVPAKP